MAKITFKIDGMDCDSCAKMIELDLEDVGIKCSCNYSKKLLEAEIKHPDDHKKIKDIVEKGGYRIAT